MENDKIYIKISPETLGSDIVNQTYSGETFGVYSGMSQILSGGTGGTSLLTGLTIPVLFTQTYDDMGFYTPFDGFILQKDVVNNFIYSADPTNQYSIRVANTSDDFKKFLSISSYTIDWGDNKTETITSKAPNYATHEYPNAPSGYTITLTHRNPWGITEVSKKVYIPTTGATIDNVKGTVTFTPQAGNWSGVSVSYDYIFTGDSENTVAKQVSSNFVTTPYYVTGYTKTKLRELKLYGTVDYDPAVLITKNGRPYGKVNAMTSGYTSYTINNVDYYDYPNNKTLFVVPSSGFTENDIISSAITKEDILIGVVDSPEIQSQIFIERGKLSGFENLQRLGEVDNMGDLTQYGYGFFIINNALR